MTAAMALLLVAASTATSTVHIVGPGCDEDAAASRELVRLIRIELSAVSEPPARVRIDPGPCGSALRTVAFWVGSRSQPIAIELVDVPQASRARVAALAFGEAVRLLKSEPARSSPEPIAPLVSPVSPDAATTSTPTLETSADRGSQVGRLAVRAGPSLRISPEGGSVFVGGQIAVSVRPGIEAPVHIQVDVSAGRAANQHSQGDVRMTVGTAGTAALFEATTDTFGLRVGPRLDVGWGWLSAVSRVRGPSAGAGGTLVLIAAAQVDLRKRMGRGVWANLGADAGGVVRGFDVTVDGDTIGGLSGFTVNVRVGVTIGL